MVQETQSAKDIDMICSKTFPIKAATCLQLGPISLDWFVDPFARFGHSGLSRRLFTHHRKYYSVLQVGMDVALYYLEHQGFSLDLFSVSRRTGNSSSGTSKSFLSTTNIVCLQEVHGEDEYLHAIQVLARGFGSLVPSFLKTKMQEDRLSAFTGTFCLRVLLFHM